MSMDFWIFVGVVAVIYIATRLLLAMLVRDLRARLHDNYRFIGPLVTPLHWVLLLASVLIGMSLIGREIGRFVWFFYFAIAWFAFRAFTMILFEGWFATIKGIQVPGVARRLISIVIVFAALLVFLRLELDVRAEDLAIIVAVVGVIIALFFQGFLRDLFLGTSMALEKPIRVGDWVSIDGHEGEVTAVDWKTTTLRSRQHDRIVVPNRRIAEGTVIHLADEIRRHHRMEISVPVDTPPSAVLSELASAVAEAPYVLSEPPPRVYYRGEQAGEGRFEASFWLPATSDDEIVRSDLRTAIWYRLRRQGLILQRTTLELAAEQLRHALAGLPFLASATPAQIDKLAQGARTAHYGRGEILFRQNDPGSELFLIFSGTLDISVLDGRRVEEKIASVGAGSFVGERSLLTGEPRSATARAAEASTVFVIGKPAMGDLLREHPVLAEEIARIMAERDEQRQQRARDLKSAVLSEAAHSMLQRIRAFFAIE